MSYIDVNGKTGTRLLKGNSGTTYGNCLLIDDAVLIADGITPHIPPPKPAPTPEYLERRRKQAIRSATLERVKYSVLGELEDGEERLAMTLVDIILAVATMSQDLVSKGLITGNEYSTRVREIRQSAVAMRNARQAAVQAITNGDDMETFMAALDAIIPPPPETL